MDQTVTINVSQASPAFSGLTASQAISYGTSTITVSGTLSAPTAKPAGQQVSVSVGGASATATVQGDATFTATIDTHAIGAATTPYAITYSYTGDTNFKSASDNSTTLTVNKATTTTVTIQSPAPNFVTNQSVTISGQSAGISSLQGQIDTGQAFPVPLGNSGAFSITIGLIPLNLADGLHVVHLTATDLAGNPAGPYNATFTLDTTPPLVTVTSPAPGLTVTQNITVAGQVTDALSGVASAEAALDGGAFAPLSLDTAGNFAFTTNLPLDDTADGPHTVHFRATDRVGNVSATTDFPFTLETCLGFGNATVAQSGGSPAGQGSVTISGCDATLREGDSFDVTLSQPVTIPSQASTLSFDYSNLAFDTTSQGRVKDAFEVALVDASGNSLVPTIAANRDAFLNVTEGQPAALGAWATIAGQTVTLDVSHVTPGTAATLVFRLVNNDGDVNTSVDVGSVRVAPLTGQPVDPGGQPGSAPVSSPAAIDFAHLADVSASIHPVYGRTSFDQPNSVLYAELAAQNAGQYFIDAPLIVAIDHLSDPTVRVRALMGRLRTAFLISTSAPSCPAVSSPPGDQPVRGPSRSTTRAAIPFTYDLVFLGHLNRPPQFTSAPKLEALVGKSYVYNATASDPENDPLTFSLLSGPSGMTVDASTGTVTWSPASTDVGNAAVALRVDDGHGGSAEQDFTLSVINPPPDRPPVFTTSPVVDGNLSTPYAYQAHATDPDSDPLTFSVVSGPQGLTVDATTGLVSWTPTVAQIGPNSVTLQVADGRGGTAVQTYTIAVGQQAGNHPPIIVSDPVLQYNIPETRTASGNEDPQSIRLTLTPGQVSNQTVSLYGPAVGTPLSLGSTVNATLTTAGQQDHYLFTLSLRTPSSTSTP